MEEELETVFYARGAVRNFGEVVFAQDFLVFEAEGAVVRGDDLQVIVFEAVPEFGLMMFFTQRRGEDVLGALEAGAGQFVDGEEQVLRAGFGEDGDASVSCGAHLVQGFFGGEMDDVDRGAGHLGHGDGAVNGFGFGGYGSGEAVVDRGGFAFGDGSFNDDVDDASVFGVEADERAVFGGAAEGLEDGAVVDHQDAGIGHEEFEAGYAFADHIVHVF